MGTEPEGRLLLSLGWPIIVSMLVQALYNVVDSVFVSRMGSLPPETLMRILGDLYTAEAAKTLSNDALAALSLVNPLQMLLISVAVGTSVGINSLISRRLGARRIEDANRAAGNGLVILVISAAVFTVAGLTLSGVYMQWVSGDPIVQLMGTHYMSICLSLCVGVFLSCGIERIMTAQGRTIFAMLMQLTGALVNIVLDRVFVLGFWFVPAMGVKGAAIATVAGQFASMILAFILLFGTKHEIRIRPADLKLKRQTVHEIYRVGLPSILMQAVGTVMMFGMNAILTYLGGTQSQTAEEGVKRAALYTGSFGTYFRLQSIIFMPVFGLTNAAMSVLGYNFGARNRKRFMRAFKMMLIYCCAFMIVGTLAFQFFGKEIISIFEMTEEMQAVTQRALRIISIGFVLAAAGISFSTSFGATDTSLYGAITSLARQLIILLPVAMLLAWITNDVDGIWWAFPIAELATLILAGLLFRRMYRKKIGPLDDLPEIE